MKYPRPYDVVIFFDASNHSYSEYIRLNLGLFLLSMSI